jgi:hypothetical protein
MTDRPSGRAALERFLRTDPRDAGCGDAMEYLDAYVELVLAGEDPEQRYPGITAHLRTCSPCAEDFDGLLALLRDCAD